MDSQRDRRDHESKFNQGSGLPRIVFESCRSYSEYSVLTRFCHLVAVIRLGLREHGFLDLLLRLVLRC